MDAKNGLYKTNQKGEKWSAEVSHQAAINEVVLHTPELQDNNNSSKDNEENCDTKGKIQCYQISYNVAKIMGTPKFLANLRGKKIAELTKKVNN